MSVSYILRNHAMCQLLALKFAPHIQSNPSPGARDRHLHLEPTMATKLNVPIPLLVMSTNDSTHQHMHELFYKHNVLYYCNCAQQKYKAEFIFIISTCQHQGAEAGKIILQQNHILLLNGYCTCGSPMALLENWLPMAL